MEGLRASTPLTSMSASAPSPTPAQAVSPFTPVLPSLPVNKAYQKATNFEAGVEVFMISPETGNSMPSSHKVGDRVGGISVALETERTRMGQKLKMIGEPEWNLCTTPGIFVVLAKFSSQNEGMENVEMVEFEMDVDMEDDAGIAKSIDVDQIATGACEQSAFDPNPADDSLALQTKKIYHVIPRSGVGRQELVAEDCLMEMRFRPGDFAWLLPAHEEEAEKEKVLILSAEVVRRQRLYNLYLVHQKERLSLVSDGRLVEFKEKEADNEEEEL